MTKRPAPRAASAPRPRTAAPAFAAQASLLLSLSAALSLPAGAALAEGTPPAGPRKALDHPDPAFAARLRDATAARFRAPVVPRFGAALPEVIATPRFLYVVDRALALPAPPWFGEGAYAAAFELVRNAWTTSQPDHARVLVVFSTFEDGGAALFYLALANDIAGLGAGKPAQVFDDTPGSVLDGVAWLGDVDTLEAAGDAYFREAFIHEIAHRWSAYAEIDRADAPRELLRGRQSMHWSFFVDSGESPMEGNAWALESPGLYRTHFESPPLFRFSPLDLYLMGVLPPEEVPPFVVLEDFTPIDPPGASVHRDSPPAHRSGIAVRGYAGEVLELSIADVIAGSGPRIPPATSGPVVWPVGVVLLSNGVQRAGIEELLRLDQHLAELARDFEVATGGLVTLDLAITGAGTTDFGVPCAAIEECDRTRADRCAPIRAGGEPVCTRSCTDDGDCGPGFCCGALAGDTSQAPICVAGARCAQMEPGEEPGREEPAPGEMLPGGGELATTTPAGCACSAARAPSRCGTIEGERSPRGRAPLGAESLLALSIAAVALRRAGRGVSPFTAASRPTDGRGLRPGGAR